MAARNLYRSKDASLEIRSLTPKKTPVEGDPESPIRPQADATEVGRYFLPI